MDVLPHGKTATRVQENSPLLNNSTQKVYEVYGRFSAIKKQDLHAIILQRLDSQPDYDDCVAAAVFQWDVGDSFLTSIMSR